MLQSSDCQRRPARLARLLAALLLSAGSTAKPGCSPCSSASIRGSCDFQTPPRERSTSICEVRPASIVFLGQLDLGEARNAMLVPRSVIQFPTMTPGASSHRGMQPRRAASGPSVAAAILETATQHREVFVVLPGQQLGKQGHCQAVSDRLRSRLALLSPVFQAIQTPRCPRIRLRRPLPPPAAQQLSLLFLSLEGLLLRLIAPG